MAQENSSVEDLREEVALNEALYNSLSDQEDSAVERENLKKTLDRLKSRLDEMQPNWQQQLPYWGGPSSSNLPQQQQNGFNSFQPSSSASSVYSNNSLASAQQSFVAPPPKTVVLSERKRLRPEDDFDSRTSKSRRSTPVPQTAISTDYVDDFDFENDPMLQSLFSDDWQETARMNEEFLQNLDARKRQEEEDEAFARQLQAKWDQDFDLQPMPKPVAAHPSSLNQSYMRPDGSWQKPSSQPTSFNVKPEYKPNFTQSGTVTPLSDSSGGFEEISPNDYLRLFGNDSTHPSPANADLFQSNLAMPGPFFQNTYSSMPNTSVYGGTLNRQQGLGFSFPFTPGILGTMGGLTGTSSGPTKMPGSFDSPLDVDAMPLRAVYFSDLGSYADPAKTQEEIKDLLKHIRPDEELTDEQLREVQPEGLKINLMPHQRKGFAWMKSMEEGTNKGGILADDMGLGKTVQAISLILARPPEGGSRNPTLIVAPLALMQQWDREIQKFVKPSHALRVLILHQENRNKSWNFIREYDVILTTYGTLGTDLKRKLIWDEHLKQIPDATPKPQQECPILGERSQFHRIILDEAQNIKNKATKAAVAACRVKANYRWCLSGTPMQNNVDEIYSLIKFCRIRPYHNYEKFARDIGRPLKRISDYGKEKAMQQLQAILKAILLRRTKKSKIDGQPIIQLPDKHTVEDRAIFSKDELEFYQQLEKQAQIQFNRYVKNGTVGRYYSHALVLLLRLRQCCCSPQLVTNAKEFLTSGPLDEVDRIANARNLPKEVLKRLDENDAHECPICMDGVENPMIFVPCGHALCNECLSAMVDRSMTDADAKLLCPHCRAEIDIKKATDLESYLRIYHPDREGVRPLDEAEEDETSDSDFSESEEEEYNSSDSGDDLKDFIVPDENADYDSEVDSDDDKVTVKALLSKDEDSKPFESIMRRSKSKKTKSKSRGKGKGKAKDKHISLAELRKEGLKNRTAKKRYIKRLTKGYVPSAKIERTISLLEEIRNRGQGEKTIIFSSFTSFLDLLEVPLSQHEELACYTRYDGSMKASDRNEAIIRFSDDPNCKVILVSLKAGNAGLNLTAANHVIILDPFWNPFVEYQAADRCYRIGQVREVTVHRVLIGESENAESNPDQDFTVEDRILRLQEKKKALVETALDEKAASSLGRLTTRDLGYLFGVNAMD